ncbi:MAG: MoaD/ThiS family protein [Gammaproteobacteria bacterium]
MPSVWIPTPLQGYTQGETTVEVKGGNIRELVENLERRYPGIKEVLLQDGLLRQGISVAVDGQIVHKGLLHPLEEGSEVYFVPSISGG